MVVETENDIQNVFQTNTCTVNVSDLNSKDELSLRLLSFLKS